MKVFYENSLTICSYYVIICSYMSITNIAVIEKLYRTFPNLTEANQQYILGLAEGLKKAQNGRSKEQTQKGETEPMKANSLCK